MASRVIEFRSLQHGAKVMRRSIACCLNNSPIVRRNFTSNQSVSRRQSRPHFRDFSHDLNVAQSTATPLLRVSGAPRAGRRCRGRTFLTHSLNGETCRGSTYAATLQERKSMAPFPPPGSNSVDFGSSNPSRLRSPRRLSTSSGDPSSNRGGSSVEGIDDADPFAEAVTEEIEGTQEEPRHSHIEMPSITDRERVGNLTSWSVKVGDAVQAGDVVCEIELEQFSVGVKVDTYGFLAEILVEAGSESVPVGAPIGTIVHTEEDIAIYQEAQSHLSRDNGQEDETTPSEVTFSWKDVLKAVLRLRQEDKFSEDSASLLMSLARNKDADLLQAFEGCYEGNEYKGEIDDDLFLMQANDIARTRRKEAEDENGHKN